MSPPTASVDIYWADDDYYTICVTVHGEEHEFCPARPFTDLSGDAVTGEFDGEAAAFDDDEEDLITGRYVLGWSPTRFRFATPTRTIDLHRSCLETDMTDLLQIWRRGAQEYEELMAHGGDPDSAYD